MEKESMECMKKQKKMLNITIIAIQKLDKRGRTRRGSPANVVRRGSCLGYVFVLVGTVDAEGASTSPRGA